MGMMPTCEQMSRFLSRSREERLSLWTRCLMALHFLICGRCAAHRDQMAILTEAARYYTDFCTMAEDGPVLPADAGERIKARLRDCPPG